MNYCFCNAENHLLDDITSTLSEKLFTNISKDLIKERYQEMIQNFNMPLTEWPKKGNYIYASFNDMAIPIENINGINFPEIIHVGIDFPIWFNFYTDKKVMIVGMEPKRRYDVTQHATISSPIWLTFFCEKIILTQRVLYKFIQNLKGANFSIYLTDISKIYGINNGQKYTGDISINDRIFCEELRIVSPDYIVTFGKSATARVQDFFKRTAHKTNSKLISLTHPAAFGGNKNYYSDLSVKVKKHSRQWLFHYPALVGVLHQQGFHKPNHYQFK